MPDRRRYGPHEGGVYAPLAPGARIEPARPVDRLPASLCAIRVQVAGAGEPARQDPRASGIVRAAAWLQRAQDAPGLAETVARRPCGEARPGDRRRAGPRAL